MLKFAFIMNVAGESPKTYSKMHETSEETSLFVGTGDMDMAAELVGQLAVEGIELINLCGDFDDDITQKFIEIGKGKIRIFHADYFPEELAKLEALPSLKEFGIISITRGLEEMDHLELFSPECNTRVMLVKDMEMACDASKELVLKGVHFIELCSWFDVERTKAIIEAIGGAVPVGSCGPIK